MGKSNKKAIPRQSRRVIKVARRWGAGAALGMIVIGFVLLIELAKAKLTNQAIKAKAIAESFTTGLVIAGLVGLPCWNSGFISKR